MGVLAAVSAVISTARLQSATSGLGTGAELSVIAAAVIGGTSFAGGIGTIPGAVLGALDHPVAGLGHAAAAVRQLRRRTSRWASCWSLAVGIDQVLRKRAHER